MDVIFRKTDFKKVMIVTLAIFAGWACCTADGIAAKMERSNGNEAKIDLKSVTLKIESKLPVACSDADSVAMMKMVNINGGWLLFASVRNDVVKVMEITTTNTNILNNSQIDISLLTQIGGVEIRDVPGRTQYVYLIANLPAGGGLIVPTVSMNVTMLMQNMITFSVESDINNVMLFGGKALALENSKNVTKIDLFPIVNNYTQKNYSEEEYGCGSGCGCCTCGCGCNCGCKRKNGEGRPRKQFRYMPRYI
ncbi:MAG: hypothetical protein LBG28_09455 [Tannerella sp.]|jgi:hypothetical protein|nr:hypothetical protein [Tannerella sp.]